MKKKLINNLFILGFVFYILFVLWNILFKYSSPFQLFSSSRECFRSINLIPFNDILGGHFNKLDIIGNVVLFIPLGIYINLITKSSKLFTNIYRIMGVSLLLECSQYVFGLGATDITDIITNTIGGIIGLVIFMIIEKCINNEVKVKNFITICSIIVMVPVAALIVALYLYN